MITVEKEKEYLIEDLNSFIWEFKVGDNIEYNLDILYKLIQDTNANSDKRYYKPISIIAVSIMEAIMVDFLYRLYSGTNHFPSSLSSKEMDIKRELGNETVEIITDSNRSYIGLKNFNLTPMIRVYEKFELLGDDKRIYSSLINLAYFRNRIHIKNYFNNFEKDENVTFSEQRVQKVLNIMFWVIRYFKDNYKRPW